MTPNELNVPESLFVSIFSAGEHLKRRRNLAWPANCYRLSPNPSLGVYQPRSVLDNAAGEP